MRKIKCTFLKTKIYSMYIDVHMFMYTFICSTSTSIGGLQLPHHFVERPVDLVDPSRMGGICSTGHGGFHGHFWVPK